MDNVILISHAANAVLQEERETNTIEQVLFAMHYQESAYFSSTARLMWGMHVS
jgi:hypothetical protein